MVTHLPHGLQKLLELTVGMPWPEGDEGDLRHLAGEWEALGRELVVVADGLQATANNLASAVRGETGTRITELLSVQLRTFALQLGEQAEAHRQMAWSAAADIEKTKIMIVGMLALLAATIAWLLASLFGSFAVPAVIAAARVGIGALLRTLLARLLQTGMINIARDIALKAIAGGVLGAGLMTGIDAGIQGWQILSGRREGFDTASLKGSAIGGAIGGALAGAAEGLYGVLGKVGKDLWNHLPKAVRGFAPLGSTLFQMPAAALSNPLISVATKSPGSAIDGIFGALEPSGGKRPAVRHVDMPDLKPLGDLGLLTPLALPGNAVTPLSAAGGAPLGVAFSPFAPRTEGGEGARRQAAPDVDERSGSATPMHAGSEPGRSRGMPDRVAARLPDSGGPVTHQPAFAGGETARVPAGTAPTHADDHAGARPIEAPDGATPGAHTVPPVAGDGARRTAGNGESVTGAALTGHGGEKLPATDQAVTDAGRPDDVRPGGHAPSLVAPGGETAGVGAGLGGRVVPSTSAPAAGGAGRGGGVVPDASALAADRVGSGGTARSGADVPAAAPGLEPGTVAPVGNIGAESVTTPVGRSPVEGVRQSGPATLGTPASAPKLSSGGPTPVVAGRSAAAHNLGEATPPAIGRVATTGLGPAPETLLRQGEGTTRGGRFVPAPTSSLSGSAVVTDRPADAARGVTSDGPRENRQGTTIPAVSEEGTSSVGTGRDLPHEPTERFATEPTGTNRVGTEPASTGRAAIERAATDGTQPDSARLPNPGDDTPVSLSEFLSGPQPTTRADEPTAPSTAPRAIPRDLGASPAWNVVDGINLVGHTHEGTRTFTSSDVQLTPMTRGSEIMGMTFTAGADRAFDVAWGQAAQIGETYRHHFEPDAHVKQPNPWPERTFFVTAHGSQQGAVTVNLTNGTPVRVDGATFARLVNDSQVFRAAVERERNEAIAMVVCYAGEPGGAAHDFQHELTSLGHRQPVFAGTTVVEKLLFPQDKSASTLTHEGEWRRFPGGSTTGHTTQRSATLHDAVAVAAADLSGVDVRTRAPREFRSDEVEATPLRRRDEVVGISFRQQERLVADQNWAQAEVQQWPADTMLVSAAGTRGSAIITLRGDDKLAVDGPNLARLLNDLPDFRSAAPRTIALLAPHSSDVRHPGGLAHDLQATLAREFGRRQEVIAPSGRHELVVLPDGTAWAVLPDGRQWRTFGLKTVIDDVVLKGLDARTMEPVVFRTSEVEATPLERNGRVLGATFWPGDDLAWASAEQSPHQLRAEPGGRPDTEARPWPDKTFLVSARSGTIPGSALVHTQNGLVAVGGTELGRLVHDLGFFRTAEQAGRAEALALLVSRSSAKNAPGGLAHDFQAALAELGHRQPVFGQPRRVAKVVLTDGTAAVSVTGPWRTHRQATVFRDVLVAGHTESGDRIRFGSSEVVVAPMEREGRIIGATFTVGRDQTFDQRWGRAEQDSRSYLFHGQASLAALTDESARIAVPRPWPADTFYVSAHGDGDGVGLHLANGTEVVVSGADFARVLADVRFFHAAMRTAQPSAIAMIVCYAGALEGPGGIARDFQATLARASGHRQPVHAATEAVVGTMSDDDLVASTAVEDGGTWRRFPPMWQTVLDGGWRRGEPVLPDLTLTGSHGTGSRAFRASEVRVAPLERGGRVIGVSFTSGDDLHVDRHWAAAPQSEATHHLPGEYDRGLPNATSQSRPWPDNAFYLAAHGDGRSVDLLLADGTRLKVDGTTFAKVLGDLRLVTTAMRSTDALVLLTCQAAANDGPGGTAHDFQRAMGNSRPVHAPTQDLWLAFQDGSAVTAVVDGGEWRRYPRGGDQAGPARVRIEQGHEHLARRAGSGASTSHSPGEPVLPGRGGDGAARWFRASDVSVSPLERDGRVVGMTFLTGPARDNEVGWAGLGEPRHQVLSDDAVTAGPAHDAFLISARGTEHEVIVELRDGAEIALDGRTLGSLLIGLDTFRSTVDPVWPEIGLLVSRSGRLADPGGTARDFQAQLAEVFGYRQRVLAPSSTIETFSLDGTAGTLQADGGWRAFTRPVAVIDEEARGGHATTGDVIWIRPSHVDFAPLIRGGTVVGVTFWTGAERGRALEWAARAEEPAHYSVSPDPAVEPVPVRPPWPRSTFVLSGPGGVDDVVVRLADGTDVRLDGQTLARVLSDLHLFRAAVDSDWPAQYALLVGNSGQREGLGGLASDLQDTLAGDLGIRQPVIAPSGRIDTIASGVDDFVATMIEEGSVWRTFERSVVQGDVTLRGDSLDGETSIPFRSSQVVATPLDRGAQIVGVTFRTGEERLHELTAARDSREDESPQRWPDRSFLVSASGDAHFAFLTLTDGRVVAVDGRTLGLVLEDLRFFQDTMDRHQPNGFVLLASRSGADQQPGGLGRDFQAVLAAEWGRKQPLAAPPHVLNWKVFEQLDVLDGSWQIFSHSTVDKNITLFGFDRSSRLRRFQSADVDVVPLIYKGRVTGASFTIGNDRSHDLWWGGAQKDDQTYLAPGRLDGAEDRYDPALRTAQATPWPDRTFYLSAHGSSSLITINLGNGTELGLVGRDFARLLGDVRFFHAAMARERIEALTLLMCKVGAVEGRLGAAHDFQAVLAERLGYHQPVYAATTTVTLPAQPPAAAAVVNGGVWRRFPPETGDMAVLGSRSGGSASSSRPDTATTTDAVENRAFTSATRTPRNFRTSDVRIRLFEKDGRPVGISFTKGADLRTDAAVFAGKPSRITHLLPGGVHKEAQYERAVVKRQHEAVPVPWPENSFFVSAHGKPGHFEVNLADGTTARLGGAAFARLVDDLRGFRDAIHETEPDAVVLLVCHAGQVAGAGGAAHGFQRALGELGYRQPVVSPTDVLFLSGHTARQWSTGVGNGGVWRVFSSGPADLLAHDRGASENLVFAPHSVEATPLMRDGRIAGVSFLADGDPATGPVADWVEGGGLDQGTAPWRERPFVVQAQAQADGRFAVRVAGGRTVEVDAPAFARVVARSPMFQAATGKPDSVLLLTSGAADGRGGRPEFARVLAGELGAVLPVFTADGLPAAGGWRQLPGPVASLPFGIDHSGALRRFEPGDVKFTVLADRDRQIGVAVGPTGLQLRAERWARMSLNHRGFTHLEPGAAEPVKAPWDKDAIFVVAPGGADSFAVKLGDGAEVRVDGRNLAEVVAGLTGFRELMARDPAGVVVLLSGGTGSGGAAHDFVRALGDLGLRKHVVAPTTEVQLRAPVFGQGGDTVLDSGGSWRLLPVPESVSGVKLVGLQEPNWGQVRFSTSDVLVRRLESADGVLRGVSFSREANLKVGLVTAQVLPASRTPPPGGTRTSEPDPWPDNSFFINAHADHATVEIELADGRLLSVDGAALARLLHDLRPFRQAMAERAPEAIVLVACSAGERTTPDSTAVSFRSTLHRLGYSHRVFAPTWTVISEVMFGRSKTYVDGGGTWREF